MKLSTKCECNNNTNSVCLLLHCVYLSPFLHIKFEQNNHLEEASARLNGSQILSECFRVVFLDFFKLKDGNICI
jgi:hypothetical protein